MECFDGWPGMEFLRNPMMTEPGFPNCRSIKTKRQAEICPTKLNNTLNRMILIQQDDSSSISAHFSPSRRFLYSHSYYGVLP